jgi:hypothetical protein
MTNGVEPDGLVRKILQQSVPIPRAGHHRHVRDIIGYGHDAHYISPIYPRPFDPGYETGSAFCKSVA